MMEIFKNYKNRRWHMSWSIIFLCLCLVCGMVFSVVKGERMRHNRHQQEQREALNLQQNAEVYADEDDDVYVSQLENSAIEDHSKTPAFSGCPNCLYKPLTPHHHAGNDVKSETDSLRLEAIKRQILSKLGLREKPNVTHSLPREVIMDTLYRAADSAQFVKKTGGEQEDMATTSARSASLETVDADDFYGRTSEIISFAEQGYMVNGNRLLEFRVSTESGQGGQEFRVRAATLWLKADVRHQRTSRCKLTDVYVFKFISNLSHSVTITSHEFDNLARDPTVTSLDESKPGWQKIDVTEMVRTWLLESSREKLRLLVDCSCCDNWRIHLFNTERDRRNDPNRPFLVIHTDPSNAKRVRKRALDCSADSGNQCCKQRFYVSFKQLGWEDWVIAPQGYFANYCRGDCGHHRTPDTYVTYHTHVIEEVRKTHHLSGMQPCCAPLKFSSMSLIYFGPDSNIIKRDLPKMVVDECGCP